MNSFKIKIAHFPLVSLSSLGQVTNFLLPLLSKNKAVFLEGELGSGKTSLIKNISKKLGNKKNVLSPSFNKMIIYENFFVHIDCYNIKNSVRLLLDYAQEQLLFVEWASCCDVKNYFEKWIEIEIKNYNATREYNIFWVFNKIKS